MEGKTRSSRGCLHPDRHTAILVSEDEGGTSWYRTRGMRKFGRPDLSCPRRRSEVRGRRDGQLIERFVEHQALGGVIAEGESIRMQALPPGGVCRHGGSLDDPDFNNVHVKIVWPGTGLK